MSSRNFLFREKPEWDAPVMSPLRGVIADEILYLLSLLDIIPNNI
jgi:hypothetical protein